MQSHVFDVEEFILDEVTFQGLHLQGLLFPNLKNRTVHVSLLGELRANQIILNLLGYWLSLLGQVLRLSFWVLVALQGIFSALARWIGPLPLCLTGISALVVIESLLRAISWSSLSIREDRLETPCLRHLSLWFLELNCSSETLRLVPDHGWSLRLISWRVSCRKQGRLMNALFEWACQLLCNFFLEFLYNRVLELPFQVL